MSDTQFLLGKLVIGDPGRDAIHIAVVPVVAARKLSPGQRAGLNDAGKAVPGGVLALGVVDPFLVRDVLSGEKFFLFLMPNTITSLKHKWTHPAFPESQSGLTETFAAEAWLRDYAWRNNTDYDYLIQSAKDGNDICFGNEQDDLNSDAGLRNEFWNNLELVTGQQMTEEQRATEWFGCAC